MKRQNILRNQQIGCVIFFLLSSTLVNAVESGSGEAILTVNDNWGNDYCAGVNIYNRGDSLITDWTVVLDLAGTQISNHWNVSRNGDTFTPETYNATISPGANVDFGFCANGTGTPAINSFSVTESDSDGSSSSSSSSGSSSSGGGSSGGGCNGYATRYWDCCKAHCGWQANVPEGINPLPSCSVANQPLSDFGTASACDGGDAHMCYRLTPWAVSDTLAYGFAATSSGDVCGRCFHIEFTGESYNGGNDPGSAALAGKTMIVQATNIGYDVGGGQFDILVPGGGVGAFNACSSQWGVSDNELGPQYGGFLAACKNELGYNNTLEAYKNCLAQRCGSVFGSRGLTELQQGCHWYVDWFQAADNPSLKYHEVACPAEITSRSGVDRGGLGGVDSSCND